MEDFIARRRLPRMSVSWPVTLYTATGEVVGKMKNLTSSGAYLQRSEQLNLNEAFWMQIGVPHRTLMLKGKAIRPNLVIHETGVDVYHAGLSFSL